MLYYCVTVTIDNSRHDEWLHWMRSEHIPDVMRSGMFLSSAIYRVFAPVSDSGVQYDIRYACNSYAEYNRYQAEFAPALQASHSERFQGCFTASRRLLEAPHNSTSQQTEASTTPQP